MDFSSKIWWGGGVVKMEAQDIYLEQGVKPVNNPWSTSIRDIIKKGDRSLVETGKLLKLNKPPVYRQTPAFKKPLQ